MCKKTNTFYPSIASQLLDLTRKAEAGDMTAEVELCDLIGSLRRSFPGRRYFDLGKSIADALSKAVTYLRSTGRGIDLRSDRPSEWITRRNGGPRWE